MESFIQKVNKTKTIIKQKRMGDNYELIIRDNTDIDYPEFYKITIEKEYI